MALYWTEALDLHSSKLARDARLAWLYNGKRLSTYIALDWSEALD